MDAFQPDEEPVGDAVCWLPQVCEECGRIHDQRSSESDPLGGADDPHAAVSR